MPIPATATPSTGLHSALERARRYRDTGADVLFVEAPQSEDEIETISRVLSDVPLLFNWAEGGKTPPISRERLVELGFRILIFPVSALLAAAKAIREVLASIRAAGAPLQLMDRLVDFGDFLELIGLPEIRQLEQRFA